TSQPADTSLIYANGGTITLSVAATGTAPITYQWMENGYSLTDGGIYSGSTTSSLTLSYPGANKNGSIYTCVVANCSGSNQLTSNPVTLAVNSPSPAGKLIHYWNFNSVTTTVTSVNSDFSAVGKAIATYGERAGVSSAYVPGYMDDINPGDTINARLGAVAGNGIRPRNPSDSMQFLLYIPTTHYQNIRIKYECERSNNGPTQQTFDYSLDSGKTFIQTGMTVTTYAPELVWALNNIDLSTINTINNNGKLVFRIRYTAGNITATNGNNRFDNITIEGDTFIAPCTPVAITAQPVSPATVCSNSGTANFTVSVSG